MLTLCATALVGCTPTAPEAGPAVAMTPVAVNAISDPTPPPAPAPSPSVAAPAPPVVTPEQATADAGQAYLAAIDDSTPGWLEVDAVLTARGGAVYVDDLLLQVDADAIFLADLRTIQFPPGPAKDAAIALILAVQEYDDYLMFLHDNFGQYGWHQDKLAELNATRSASSARLRELLGLPAPTGGYQRP